MHYTPSPCSAINGHFRNAEPCLDGRWWRCRVNGTGTSHRSRPTQLRSRTFANRQSQTVNRRPSVVTWEALSQTPGNSTITLAFEVLVHVFSLRLGQLLFGLGIRLFVD